MFWPVMYVFRGLANQSTTSAISAGCASLPIGTFCKIFSIPESPNILRVISVSTKPGATQFAKIPDFAYSIANESVRPSIANLLEE